MRIYNIKEYINVIANEYLYDEIVNGIHDSLGQKMSLKYWGYEVKKNCYVPSITVDIPHAVIPMSSSLYSRDTILFRVRKIASPEYQYTIQDFWEPPKEVIRPGRLNQDGEQMLYCSVDNSRTALKEARINVGDTYIIIFYRVKDKISVNKIGFDLRTDILKIVNEFFGKSGEAAYKLSEKLAKMYKLDYCDGWIYPSVLHEKGINICLDLSAKTKLDLVAVHECKRLEESDKYLSILDINSGSVSRLNDWDNPDGQAYSALNRFNTNYKKWIQSNLSHHAKDMADPQNHHIPPTVKMIGSS